MCVVVVHDQVDFRIGGKVALQMVEEEDELLAAVSVLACTDHLAIENVEGGKQRRRAVTLVIVRLPLGQPRWQWKDRGDPVQCLDLALLVHAQYQRAVRRIQVKADNVPHFCFKLRIIGQFEALDSVWLPRRAAARRAARSFSRPEGVRRTCPHSNACCRRPGELST